MRRHQEEPIDRTRSGSGWVAGLVIAAVAIGAVAALPGRSIVATVDDEPPGIDQLSTQTALVVGKQASGGLKIAGVRLREKTYRIDLQFLAGERCGDNDPAGVPTGLCDGPDGLKGRMVGISMSGDLILSTRVEVSRDCYDLTYVADPWSSTPECRGNMGD